MIFLAEARRIIPKMIQPRPALAVPLAEAHGLVLAEDVVADAFYPAGDRSQMDGYVVRDDAVPGSFFVAGEIPAGAIPGQALQPGECYRIFTGALLPEGGGRVIMQEEATREGDRVVLPVFGEKKFVRYRGSEAKPGDVRLAAGSRLGAAELAILAQLGAVQPRVIPAPRVRHLATGGELVDPSLTPGPGQIRDTNTHLLRALFSELGVRDFQTSRIADDPDATAEAAETEADLLILSGGASVGDYDFGAAALRKLGYQIHFDRVNLRPGKPLTFATRGAQAAFVIPGNPVSHYVCFHAAVRLAVECFTARPATWPAVWVPLAEGATLTPDPRDTWWPARVRAAEGQLTVTPKRWSSSGDTFSLAGTNALVLVNPDSPWQGRALTLLLEAPAC